MLRAPWILVFIWLVFYGLLDAIVIDGRMEDWTDVQVIHEDPDDETYPPGKDLVEVRLANDSYNLYVFIAFASPVNLSNTSLRMLIDADSNPTTGIPDSGRGMDFTWRFADNRGISTLTSRGDIGRGNLVERIAPYGSSSRYEFAISLEALPAVAEGAPVHLAFVETESGDRIPDSGTIMTYTVEGPVAVQPLPISVNRDPGAIRIVSWNVLRDAAFERGNEAAFVRILAALQPDVFMLQEVYDTPTEVVRSLFEDNLQIRAGDQWEIARQHDCITVSRFPILRATSSDGNLVCRLDTEPYVGSNLLIGNAHFPCCEDESGRIRESVNMLRVIDTYLEDGDSVPHGVIIGGDLNSGGLAPELIRLTTGRVPLEMASPRHLYQYDQYTWGSLGSSYGSSRLDFLLFDPATLFRRKAFILDTDMLPAGTLSDLSLTGADTFISDHLPLVLDLSSPKLPEGLEATPMAVDGSATSGWFGEINGYHYPDILHESLGWIRIYEEGNGYWVRLENGTWSWTGPATYPWVYFPRFK